MITRSGDPTVLVSPAPTSTIPSATPSDSKPAFHKYHIKSDDDEQREVIRKLFYSKYQVNARDLQVDAVMSLVRNMDTFLIASTGYGKSRIPEMFSMMFVKSSNPIVLILNPLDALGDNQVSHSLFVIGVSNSCKLVFST